MVRPWKASSKAMIAGTLGVSAGNLDCVLYRFRAAVDENSFLGKFSRRDFVHPLGEADVAFVGRDLDAGVQESVELVAHGFDHGFLAMTDVRQPMPPAKSR